MRSGTTVHPAPVARLALAALLAAAIATSLVAPVAGNGPSSRPVCSVCGTALAETVDDRLLATAGVDRAVDLSVTGSEVAIDVRTDGAAEWTVRNRLANASAARYLRERPEERADLVAAALARDPPGRPAPGAISDVRTRIEGRTLVVLFRHAGFAERRPGGVLLSDYLFVADDGYWLRLTVDELTVRPPPGYVVTNRPAGASAAAAGVTWTGGRYAPPVDDAYVAVAPDDAAVAGLATRAALAGATLPYVVAHLRYVLPGVALFGALVWGLGRLSRRLGGSGGRDSDGHAGAGGPDPDGRGPDGREDSDQRGHDAGLLRRAGDARLLRRACAGRERLGGALVVGGLPLVVLPLVAGGASPAGASLPLSALGLLYTATGVVALRPGVVARGGGEATERPTAARNVDTPTTRLLALPVAVVLVAGVGRLLASAPVGGPVLAGLARESLLAAPVLPAGLLLPAGYAVARGARPRRWAVASAAVLLGLALAWSSPGRPPGDFAPFVAAALLVGAVLWVVAGSPLFAVGRLVALDGGVAEGDVAAEGGGAAETGGMGQS